MPIRKEITKNNKEGNESVTTKSYKIKVIDSAKFMASSLSNLVNNLAEGMHKIKCKDCYCFPEYESVQDNLIKYRCLSFNACYSNQLDEELRNKFKNICKLSNNDINKFTLLLRKGIYPYKYMNDWEKFNELTLLETEEFFSNLNMEEIRDADYTHVKRVCKDFEVKNLDEYQDLCFKGDALFWLMCFRLLEKCV